MENKPNIFNIEAEQIVLGALIINNDFYDKIDFIKHIFFYEPAHQIIYDHIKNLISKNLLADSITLKAFFDNDDLLKTIGGSKYLSILLSMGAGIVDIVDYAKIIQDFYKKRCLYNLLKSSFEKIEKNISKITSKKLIDSFRNNLDKIEDNTDFKYNIKPIENILTKRLLEIKLAIDNNETFNKDIIPTGFYDFDKKFNGLTKGELITLAGCSSMGKTTIALQKAINFARKKLNTIFFSLEMKDKSLINKVIANVNKINSQRINYNNVYSSEIEKVNERCNEFLDSTLYIDDTYAIDCNYINKVLKRFIRKKGAIDVIIVDYLQIMQDTYKEKNRVREIGNITNGLKEIAKKFNCVVICLSQLSRNVESRDDKRPILRDLRDSGEIEQISDMVIFAYRHHYYEKRKLSKFDKNKPEERETWEKIKYKLDLIKNDCELLVRKNRNGRCGDIKLHFEGKYSRTIDIDKAKYEKNIKQANIPYQK